VCWNCKVLGGNYPIATRIREKGLRKTLRDKVFAWGNFDHGLAHEGKEYTLTL
jgi:hypothetical protein